MGARAKILISEAILTQAAAHTHSLTSDFSFLLHFLYCKSVVKELTMKQCLGSTLKSPDERCYGGIPHIIISANMGNNSLLLHLIPLSGPRLCNYLGYRALAQKAALEGTEPDGPRRVSQRLQAGLLWPHFGVGG